MLFFLVLIAFASATPADKLIYSTTIDRVLLNSVTFKVPSFYPLPPVRYNQSLDSNNARWASWAFVKAGEIDARKAACIASVKQVFGIDFGTVTEDALGVRRLPEATMAPISRRSGPNDRLMFDSEYKHRTGEWGAGEGGWNFNMETNGLYGGEKTGATRVANKHLLQCVTFYFYEAGTTDAEIAADFRKLETMNVTSYNPTVLFENEWGKQNMLAETRLVFENGQEGQLTETITQNKVPGLWVIRSDSFFKREIAVTKRANDKKDNSEGLIAKFMAFKKGSL